MSHIAANCCFKNDYDRVLTVFPFIIIPVTINGEKIKDNPYFCNFLKLWGDYLYACRMDKRVYIIWGKRRSSTMDCGAFPFDTVPVFSGKYHKKQ